MNYNLKDKNIIITGGSSGIGESIIDLLLKNKANVVNIDVNDNLKTKTIITDITNNQDVTKILNSIPKKIDILINNAGIGLVGNIENTDEKDFDKIFEVNVKGLFNITKVIIPRMKQNGGSIINMASTAAIVGIDDRFAYSASKGAVMSMTNSIAKDYLSYGIRCNSISPGRVHTPFVDSYLEKFYPNNKEEMFEKLSKTQPLGRMAKPYEVASLVLYLCIDEASLITGSDFQIDGGFVKLNT
ncbi:MAG: short-chain dehydrogenase [Flavobacteriaceae bacterium]|nr:short-chain dehydrogenase [Flavobacteriaceae bacterium]|tara:strand:- start:883 stop:1611 length:729 start_codon:yes stop_codon:yes gene_type:complete